MHRVVAGATGLIGKQLVEYWLSQSHTVTVIGRSRAKITALFGNRVHSVEWDELTQYAFDNVDVVVNLCGANIAKQRWTAARKLDILHSRTEATKKIALLLALRGPAAPPLLNASAIGVYGLQQGVQEGLPPAFEEDKAIDWQQAPDFLAQVGREWEKATRVATDAGVRVVNLRFGVVLSRSGGALPELMRPFQFFVGGRLGSGEQPFSWVALTDVIRAIDFLAIRPDVSGPVNIVAPQCVRQRELAQTLGRVLHRPSVIPVPAIVLKCMLGQEMATELLLQGQHVYPQRLLELGFQFECPDLRSGLEKSLAT